MGQFIDRVGMEWCGWRVICRDTTPNLRHITWIAECVSCGRRRTLKGYHFMHPAKRCERCFLPRSVNNLVGQRFGRWFVLSFASIREFGGDGKCKSCQAYWHCVCDCGNKREICGAALTRRRQPSRSCGCVNLKHGHTWQDGVKKYTRTYRAWRKMRDRCYDDTRDNFHCHGGRGIKVCQRWQGQDGFVNFLIDLGECPNGMTLERIDNDDNYKPGNCRWATMHDQSRNKRNNVMLSLNGKTQCLTDWAWEYKISVSSLWYRLFRHKWPLAKALKTPSRCTG